MNKIFLLAVLFASALSVGAQSASDPVLITINGKQVTKSEFEYSFHKNGNVDGAVEKKSVSEYVPMFINYKLKVAAAEAAKLDTLQSFQKEFRTYRDMQLTPYMIDREFIDSIAHAVYNNTAKKMDGKDLIETSHILLALKQNATDADKLAAKAQADSIYQAVVNGADFGDMARRFSADKGSAAKNGKLPPVGPGAFVKEFEDAAYALKAGEMSKPVLSPFGYHIIKMESRKPLDPFEKVRPDIMNMLKRQNIEEASSLHRIDKMVAASGGRLTREAVLDSVMNAHIKDNAELRYLIQEYHDGLLLYEISKREIWDAAINDSIGLEKWYIEHKRDYAWNEPYFKGYVYHCKDAKQAKLVKKMLKKYSKLESKEWRKQLLHDFNKDSVTVSINGPYLCKKGENSFIDTYIFKTDKTPAKSPKGFVVSGAYGKLQKQPQSYLDVKPQVISDYQNKKEEDWIEMLRQRFAFTVNEDVLKTVR